MASSTMTSKGQVTIPKSVRERLGLSFGDRLIFRFDDEGRLIVKPESPSHRGGVPGLLEHLGKGRSATAEEMDESIREHLKKKFDKAGSR